MEVKPRTRYTVNPDALDPAKYPPIDPAIPYDSAKADEQPVEIPADNPPDPDAHITDPDEYLKAKQRRAAWLKDTDVDEYMRMVRPPVDDEQPEP